MAKDGLGGRPYFAFLWRPEVDWHPPGTYAFLLRNRLVFESAVTAQNDEFKDSFDSSSDCQETHYWTSMLSDTLVGCICRNINLRARRTELALGKFYLDFHRVTWPWRWTLTNGSDVKYTVVSWNWARDLRRSSHSALLGVQIWWLAFFVRSQGKCSGHRRGQVGAGITHHRHTRRGLRWGGHTRFHSPWLSLGGGGGWRGGWGWWWRPVCHFQVTGSEWQMIWRCVVFAERLALETLTAYH